MHPPDTRLRTGPLVPILHFMVGSAAESPTAPEERQPAPPEEPPRGPGVRASDAERDEVASRLRDEFVAGRLSHETFMHRVNRVYEARRQADLPPLVADLPLQARPGARSLGGWLRGTWSRVAGAVARSPGARAPGQAGSGNLGQGRGATRSLTNGMPAAPERRRPYLLEFPRGGGQFSIGRDASCDLAVADLSVSRVHARLERTQDGWLLSDLESTNGTRVNGWRVRGTVPVHAGDLVSFGNLEVVFSG